MGAGNETPDGGGFDSGKVLLALCPAMSAVVDSSRSREDGRKGECAAAGPPAKTLFRPSAYLSAERIPARVSHPALTQP